MFILDPPKIGSPQNEIFWTHSEKFVPTIDIDQPDQGKSVHVNGHEVTTKDISGVHRGTSRNLNDWFPSGSVCHNRRWSVSSVRGGPNFSEGVYIL